jgi:hypothetical protein
MGADRLRHGRCDPQRDLSASSTRNRSSKRLTSRLFAIPRVNVSDNLPFGPANIGQAEKHIDATPPDLGCRPLADVPSRLGFGRVRRGVFPAQRARQRASGCDQSAAAGRSGRPRAGHRTAGGIAGITSAGKSLIGSSSSAPRVVAATNRASAARTTAGSGASANTCAANRRWRAALARIRGAKPRPDLAERRAGQYRRGRAALLGRVRRL